MDISAELAVDLEQPLPNYGLDSLAAMRLLDELAERVQRPLSPVLLWEHSSIAALIRHLASGADAAAGPRAAPPSTPATATVEPIAIIGMAGRFPGAADLAAFWRLLTDGVDATSEVPLERWEGASPDATEPASESGARIRRAAFLDRVDAFDPQFFRISPREAREIDPQQRLGLELAWEALEDAGIPPLSLQCSATGVFLGAMWRDYGERIAGAVGGVGEYGATGQAPNMIANRVSYFLGLRGPSLVVDTACSSSLVAVHLGCQSLRCGESSLALVGGVNLLLSAHTMLAMSRFGGLSPDGRCKPFGAAADGYGRGEGGAVLVLKPLSRAVADGDRIYALVRGSAVNNDGPSNGLTAPSPRAQEELLRSACRSAGVAPEQIHYVEAHGTGTRLGDPIEAKALGSVLGAGRDAARPLVLGSVKGNIGHLEAAAGVAGLVKTVLALGQRRIPPSLHCQPANPYIPFAALGLQVAAQDTPWPVAGSEPALAGVSSFGWGGTNAHVVVEGPPLLPSLPSLPSLSSGDAPPRGSARRVVFVCAPQGGQWPGMGRQLLRSAPAFRAAFLRCERALLPHLGWSLCERLYADAAGARLTEAGVAQPLLFAFAVALAAELAAHGIVPDAVFGHCLGEVAAAHLAGVLDLDDAAHVIHHYSRVQQQQADRGGMASIELPAREVEALLQPHPERLAIAGYNGVRSTVISGELGPLQAVLAQLKERGVLCGRVRINAAPHSPQMAGAAAELTQALAGLRPRQALLPLYSTVTGERLAGPEVDAAYFGRNLRAPARVTAVTERLLRQGLDLFVELGPGPVLTPALAQGWSPGPGAPLALAACLRGESEAASLRATCQRLREIGAAGERPQMAQLLPLSARSPQALRALAAATADQLAAQTVGERALADLAYTAGARRSHLEQRLGLVAATADELTAALRAFVGEAASAASAELPAAPPKVVFVFAGQGAQWPGMGRSLLRTETAFRDALLDCERALRPFVGFSLLDELAADETTSRLGEVDVVQPLLWAVQVALAALWRSWGIEPAAVIGHSMGEVAAACVAGALSLEDGARVIAWRSRLVRQHACGQGAMAVVELPAAAAAQAIAAHADRLAVAVVNGPYSTVLSGQPAALEQVLATLRERGVFCRLVKVDYASHSPQMDALLPSLRQSLAGLRPRAAAIPFLSTMEAGWLDGERLDADYWARNLRAPVQFAAAVDLARAQGHRLFVEVGPHPLLCADIEQSLAQGPPGGAALPSLRRDQDGRRCLLQSLAALYMQGCPVDFAALHPHGGQVVPLPLYPWQRERYWVDAAAPAAPPPAVAPAHWYYELAWLEPQAHPAARSVSPGLPILILGDRGGVGARLAGELVAAGAAPRLWPAERADELLRALAAGCEPPASHLVYLGALDGPDGEEVTAAELLAADAQLGCGALLRWLPDFATAAGPGGGPRLWLVTRGAVPAAGRGGASSGAPLWGLGRVLAQEHPELWGGLWDLDPAPQRDEQAMRRLAATLLAAELDEEDQVALRGEQRLCARLVRSVRPAARPAPLKLRPDAAYLITGGLGRLGLELARWLIARGARHLLLLSRTPLSDAAPARRQQVEALRARGAAVDVRAVDVADHAALQAALAASPRPLAGVLHAAGVADWQPLLSPTSVAALQAALAAKAAGALHLDQLTSALALDFFVLFSSAAAVFGGRGQGHYAAANHFLDALAHARRARGLPALSINWGLWADGGIGSDRVEQFAQSGLRPMATAQALAALDALVAGGCEQAQQLVADLDWPRFQAVYETRARRRLLAGLADLAEESATPPAPLPPPLARQLAAASPGEAQRLLGELITQQVRRVLGFGASAELRPGRGFFDLGMDSTLAAQLMTAVGNALGERLPMMLAFEHPTVTALTSCLLRRLGIAPAVAPLQRPPDPASPMVPPRGSIESDGEEELAARLAAKLARVR